MQITIDIKDSAYDKVMYILNHLQDDVTILENSESIEIIDTNSKDYQYILQAHKRRENGEELHLLEDIIKEFE